jgi:hypothetical protein
VKQSVSQMPSAPEGATGMKKKKKIYNVGKL